MKINVNKNVLSEAIQLVQNIIPTKTPLPILSNILLQTHKGKIQLVATDLDIGISKIIDANILEQGGVTLPAKRISSIVRELPDEEIEIIVKKNNTTIIKSGSCILKLVGIGSEEFPSLPKIEEGNKIQLKAKFLRNLFKMTSFAISKDETRYVLNGLLFIIQDKTLTLVATDGKRLALCKEDMQTNKNYSIKVIIPYKTVLQVEKMLEQGGDIKINIGENQILFQIEDTLIISRLIEGEFPDYNQVIPEETESKLYVDKDMFLNSLRRANILTTADSMGVKLDISKKDMVISKNTPEIGEIKERITGEYKGKNLSVGFNPGYLIEVLKNFPKQDLAFEITEPEKPGVIRLNDKYLYLVLPMQLG